MFLCFLNVAKETGFVFCSSSIGMKDIIYLVNNEMMYTKCVGGVGVGKGGINMLHSNNNNNNSGAECNHDPPPFILNTNRKY